MEEEHPIVGIECSSKLGGLGGSYERRSRYFREEEQEEGFLRGGVQLIFERMSRRRDFREEENEEGVLTGGGGGSFQRRSRIELRQEEEEDGLSRGGGGTN